MTSTGMCVCVCVKDEARMIMDLKKNTWYRCNEMMRCLAADQLINSGHEYRPKFPQRVQAFGETSKTRKSWTRKPSFL